MDPCIGSCIGSSLETTLSVALALAWALAFALSALSFTRLSFGQNGQVLDFKPRKRLIRYQFLNKVSLRGSKAPTVSVDC